VATRATKKAHLSDHAVLARGCACVVDTQEPSFPGHAGLNMRPDGGAAANLPVVAAGWPSQRVLRQDASLPARWQYGGRWLF
jgi:hypothetical protein